MYYSECPISNDIVNGEPMCNPECSIKTIVAKNKSLPCHVDCPKCGSEDIKRQHCRSNMTIVAYDRKEKFEDEYIKCYDYRVEIKKECIFNHCRACHYEWAVDVL